MHCKHWSFKSVNIGYRYHAFKINNPISDYLQQTLILLSKSKFETSKVSTIKLQRYSDWKKVVNSVPFEMGLCAICYVTVFYIIEFHSHLPIPVSHFYLY